MVKFLIIRFASTGDLILTTPVIRNLKEQVEDAEVHYLVGEGYAALLEANPFVDRIHVYEGNMRTILHTLKKEGFDYIIDLQNNVLSARIKLGLKRMDFTIRSLRLQRWLRDNLGINRMPAMNRIDLNMECISLFVEKDDGKGPDYFLPEGADADGIAAQANEILESEP